MNRKKFLRLSSASTLSVLAASLFADGAVPSPETYILQDDGRIPNSRYPLLVYRKAFTTTGSTGAAWLEDCFATNNWTNSWRNGVFPYHHYHSTSHEVLGVYSGTALLHMGGEKGKQIRVAAGDILVIPAGVGHKKLKASQDFGVVGAYPDGRSYDVLRGEPGERPRADQHIAALPRPMLDPLTGAQGGVQHYWTV
ncbi:cupin domain-containing protein [Hymenobacter sp. YC55]|uniref:cupin domain-containing protein n=1 Tax=Hymenobacter sp. YC55 TaxID=3034019 RepID=UPI0023F7DBE5|nr:cupin domain-containing protein [Hymenobacter sp. YC55]MDF7814700.1 cupin domain-containing protein [Hymenobacter sp. YC55]